MTLAKQFVQSALGKFGYRLVRSNANGAPAYGLDCIFPLLKRFGFAPKHVIDVGANRGNWTRAALRYFPNASYTLVEPQDELKVHIQDLLDRGDGIRWINAGAGEKSGCLPFLISPRDDSSTFVEEEHGVPTRAIRRINVAVRTLDEILSTLDLPIPDMVKIDAEGFDLKVLSGASSLIGKTQIFFIEAAVCCGYENRVSEVVGRMAKSGYELLDLTDINRSPKYGVLWLFELVFLKKGSRLLASVTSYE
ncbi:MAG: FkbM family methyltransferase [Candidatus Acidiferrales bacterium]